MFETLLETTPSAALLVLSALRALAAIPFKLTGQNSRCIASANDVARAVPCREACFCQQIKDFYAVRAGPAGGRLCPVWQFMPARFCVSQGNLHAKIRGFPWAIFWSKACYGRRG